MDAQEKIEKTRHYRFLEVTVNLDRREIVCAGELMPVQRKVFDLLLYLIENRQRAVGKDELQDAVWPGTIVTETALTRAIMKARRVVGDDAVRQQAIKTVHGHGYRFVADLSEAESLPRDPAQAMTPWKTLRRRRVLRGGAVYAAVAWILAQGGDIAFETFEWSKFPLQILLILLAIGFPVTLLLAWVYQLTPQGLKKESEFREPLVTRHTATGDRLLIGFLVVALSISVFLNFRSTSIVDTVPRIAVLPVANAAEDMDLEWTRLGLMGLMNRIVSEREGISVVSARAVLGLVDENENPVQITDQLRDKLRRIHGANYVVLPRLERDNELLKLSATIVSEQGHWEMRGHVDNDATVLARILSTDIVSRINPDAMVKPALRVISDDSLANQAYAKGMEQQLVGNLEEAKRFFNAAIVLDPEGFWPRYEHALITRILGDYDDAEQQLLALLAESRDGEDPRATYSAHNALGIVYMRTGRLDESEKHLLQGLELTQRFEDPMEATSLLTNLGIITKNRGDYAQSHKWLQQALVSYRASKIEVVPGSLYNTLGNLSANQGDLEAAYDYFSKALASFQLVGQKRFEASVLNNLGWIRARQRRFSEALVFNQESMALRHETGDKVGVVRSQRSIANLYLDMHDYLKAEEMALLVLASPEANQNRNLKASALSALGRVAMANGDFATAEEKITQAIQLNTEDNNLPGVLDQQLKLVRVYIEGDELDQAQTLSQNLLKTARAENQSVSEVRALLMLGEVAMKSGNDQEAMSLLTQGRELAKELNNLPLEAMAMDRLATVYMDTSHYGEAAGLVALLEETRPTSPDTLMLQARLANAKGQHDDALEFLRAAKAEKRDAWAPEDEAMLNKYSELAQE